MKRNSLSGNGEIGKSKRHNGCLVHRQPSARSSVWSTLTRISASSINSGSVQRLLFSCCALLLAIRRQPVSQRARGQRSFVIPAVCSQFR